MDAGLEQQLQQLKDGRTTWEGLLDQVPETFKGPNNQVDLEKDVITNKFNEAIDLLEEVCNRDDIDSFTLSIRKQGVLNEIGAINRTMGQLPAQLGNHSHYSNLISNFSGLISQLLWLAPISNAKEEALVLRQKNLLAQADRIEKLTKKLERSLNESSKDRKTNKDLLANAQKAFEEITAYERQAQTSKNNANAAATEVESDKNTVADELEKVQKARSDYDVLFDGLSKKKEEIEGLLTNAAQVGLAASFQERRKRGEKSRKRWAWLLFAALTAMTIAAAFASYPAWHALSSAKKIGSHEALSVLARIPILVPIIWAAWFFGRQFGHVNKVTEDYAFKEASALAYRGYRNEMLEGQDEDKNMLKELQKSAIENFGSNPIRLIDDEEPGSPTHDLISRILNSRAPDKIAEALQSLANLIDKARR